jgi:hypothetical protein
MLLPSLPAATSVVLADLRQRATGSGYDVVPRAAKVRCLHYAAEQDGWTRGEVVCEVLPPSNRSIVGNVYIIPFNALLLT